MLNVILQIPYTFGITSPGISDGLPYIHCRDHWVACLAGHSASRYVYHYTSVETARDHILKTGTLRLGQLAATNDPRESKNWEFSLWTSGKHDLGQYKFQECSDWFSSALKSNVRLACFSLDRGPLTGDHTEDILQRGFANPTTSAPGNEAKKMYDCKT